MWRRLIINTFEVICIAMVVVPTALGILFILVPSAETQSAEIAVLATLGVFLLTTFLAGGALTLVEIAHNTKGTMEVLRDIREGVRAPAVRAGAAAAVESALNVSDTDS